MILNFTGYGQSHFFFLIFGGAINDKSSHLISVLLTCYFQMLRIYTEFACKSISEHSKYYEAAAKLNVSGSGTRR